MGRTTSLSPLSSASSCSSFFFSSSLETWPLGVDGVEARVAVMYWGGGGKKSTGTTMFCFCFLFFFVPKSTARVLYF